MTLVELLVVMLIISILAGLVLGVAAIAGETAREASSRHVVERLHNLLGEYYETYKTRRVNVRQPIIEGINQATGADFNTAAKKGKARAIARLHALRELMRMEIPDRWSDVLLTDVPTDPASGVTNGEVTYARYPYFQDLTNSQKYGRTSLSNVYLRRYAQIAKGTNAITNAVNTHDDIVGNESAECLYMIVTLATGDGEARTLFAEHNIGDTDGDGAPEFLDGWGHPIQLLRWAPGFNSEIQINANKFNSLSVTDAWRSEALTDHDPFDVFRVDEPAFRLVPLIFSAGRDEALGIQMSAELISMGLTQGELNGQKTSPPNPNNWRVLFPWANVVDATTGTEVFLGTDLSLVDSSIDQTATDNVHNHMLGLR